MRAGLAFWAGVVGAAVMVIGLWISYAAGGTDFSFSWWWGSMALGNISSASWILGFVIHLILGGLIALIFGAVFEAIGRSNWGLGLLGGLILLVIAGFGMEGIAAVHPAIPQVIPDPGYFTANYGPGSIATFCAVFLVYGIIVGSMYVPVHTGRRRETLPREQREPVPGERPAEMGAKTREGPVVETGERHPDEHVVGAGVGRPAERPAEPDRGTKERYGAPGRKEKPPQR
jgi:hypothetical protein